MKIQQLLTYFHTLRFMKSKQIGYRLYYTIRNRIRRKTGFSYPLQKSSTSVSLHFTSMLSNRNTFKKREKGCRFTFLNLSHLFEQEIDWNYADFGKLWTYNLTYFEYLLQKEITKEEALFLIKDFIAKLPSIKDGLEPFPLALRGMNWVKYLSREGIKEQHIDDALYAQYAILMDNLEYHLLGNHLLENGYSLLFGAYYFQDQNLFAKAKEILIEELQEQILEDGAHFELTPMYHQLMLYRLLDCINLMQNNTVFIDKELSSFLYKYASLMLGWLVQITFKDGSIPHFNDSTEGIAPSSRELFTYAKELSIPVNKQKLSQSGYRKFVKAGYELVVDVGNIGPDYIPGHAHSDTLSFVLYAQGSPLVVDTAISTYETNTRRLYERRTAAHNTVVINGWEQSEVWSSFRVAKRAKIVSLKEGEDFVVATHDGYVKRGFLHSRKFIVKEQEVVIEDRVESLQKRRFEAIAYFHLRTMIKPKLLSFDSIQTERAKFVFKGAENIEIVDNTIADGFNSLHQAWSIKVYFNNSLDTAINIIL